jgi:hypothetical protein
MAYAIPTKDEALKTLSLDRILNYVHIFRKYADDHPELRFQLVAIGCGLAGYDPEQIVPMFGGCPVNIELPFEFTAVLNRRRTTSPFTGVFLDQS